ncbi:DUF5685 family protein [Ruminococcus bromii]|uniref:DUF5685 family protein n=1 Tax=Ruminococcus bromii TaxID=40518 RepID=UPI003AB5A674
MFGYLQIQKSELLVREAEAYKAVYCGLCRQMGKDYSGLTRFTLSYDCTFYAMFLMSLNRSCKGFKDGRCTCNPLKKCKFATDEGDAYGKAAAFSMISVYYKIIDDIQDSGFFKKLLCRIIKPFFSHQRKKAADKYPDMDKAVSDMMKMQYDAEHSEKPSVDMSAHPTALMLAAVLSAEAHDEIQKRVLYEFGYHIGRWIYLVDAADDIEKDIKSNGFNPFVNKKTGEVKSLDFIKAVLNQSLARAYDAYNLLNFTDFKGILDNMMLLGFPASQNRVTSKLDTEVNNE